MALGALAQAGVAAGVTALGQGLNAYSTGKMNKRAEQFAYRMYGQQRSDALADWNMQNAYNDPSAQMERLKGAGLNPHLVYGNGANAQMAAPTRGSSASSPNYKVPQIEPGSVIFNALQAKQLQSNIARTDAETAAIMARTTEQNYRNIAFTPELFKQELEAKIEGSQAGAYSARMSGDVQNNRADIVALERDNLNLLSGRAEGSTRQAVMKNPEALNLVNRKFAAGLNEILQRTENLKSVDANLKLDGFLKQFEADFIKQIGVDKSVAGQVINNLMKIFLLTKTK